MLNLQIKESKPFELVMQVRDKDGNPTGKTKSISTDISGDIWQFYMSNKPKKKHKKKKENPKALPHGKQADLIVRDMAEYAKTVRKNKRKDNEDQED